MRTDVRANPFAGLSQADDATPDVAAVARMRSDVLAATAIATLLAAPNLATPDVYIDPSLCAGPWLDALADELYADGGQ